MTFSGVDRIAQERSRQINVKGYSRDGDVDRAAFLVEYSAIKLQKAFDILLVDGADDTDAIEHVKKAGALCAAAIDSIVRTKEQHERNRERYLSD